MAAYKREDIIDIERFIESWDKDNLLAWEYDISHLPLSILRTIFKPEPKDDYELVHIYLIEQIEADVLNSFLDVSLTFDFNKNDYFLATYGVYQKKIT